MLVRSLWTIAIAIGYASCANVMVNVGDNGNSYAPSTITARVGDFVTFQFSSSLHDIAQSSALAPCSYGSSAGFFSSQQSNSNASFTIAITDTKPKYFFCSVGNHCNLGMVGVINPSDVTQSEFAKRARSAAITTPRGVAHVGGNLTIGTSSAIPGSTGANNASRPATASVIPASKAAYLSVSCVVSLLAVIIVSLPML